MTLMIFATAAGPNVARLGELPLPLYNSNKKRLAVQLETAIYLWGKICNQGYLLADI
jgi:hypothetical protein